MSVVFVAQDRKPLPRPRLGDQVRILEGVFHNFDAKVVDVDENAAVLAVMPSVRDLSGEAMMVILDRGMYKVVR